MTRDTIQDPGPAPVPPSPHRAPPPEPPTPTDGPDWGAAVRLGALLLALAALAVWRPWLALVLLGVVVMITLHELGHYVMARRAGMQVTEFFLFFGPKIWSVRRGETEYGIKCIPAGAYVRIPGMSNLEEVPPEDEARAYRQKSFGQRFGVAVAGSTVHFLLALALIYVSLVAIGQPAGTLNPERQADEWRVGMVAEGSGADAAGLRAGDRIVRVAGERTDTWERLRDAVRPNRGKTVPLSYERDGRRVDTTVDIRAYRLDGTTQRGLGITLGAPPDEKVNPVAGVVRAPAELGSMLWLSGKGLGKFLSPSGISDFAGQVGNARADRAAIENARKHPRSTQAQERADRSTSENRVISMWGFLQIGSQAGSVDPGVLLVLFAYMNAFIGIFNLIPLLPFDGGHVAVAVYEKIQEWRLGRRRYIADLSRLMPVTYVVVMLLAVLFFSSLYLDIANPVTAR